MNVVLYRVGRNLNRAYRTCVAFGVQQMILVANSDDPSIQWELRGNLFSARGQLTVFRQEQLPDLSTCCALETYYHLPLREVDWRGVDSILIGGETRGLPRDIHPLQAATIPTAGRICLTVEAALAIALYEWWRGRVP